MTQYTDKDYKKGQPRWCPGCGDHFFLASLHKAMAELGVPPYELPLSQVLVAQADCLTMSTLLPCKLFMVVLLLLQRD